MKEKLESLLQCYLGMHPRDVGCKSWSEMQSQLADKLIKLFNNESIDSNEKYKYTEYYIYYYKDIALQQRGIDAYWLIPSNFENLEEKWYAVKLRTIGESTIEEFIFSEKDLAKPEFENYKPTWVKDEVSSLDYLRKTVSELLEKKAKSNEVVLKDETTLALLEKLEENIAEEPEDKFWHYVYKNVSEHTEWNSDLVSYFLVPSSFNPGEEIWYDLKIPRSLNATLTEFKISEFDFKKKVFGSFEPRWEKYYPDESEINLLNRILRRNHQITIKPKI